jgi:hypothetical protein
MHFSTPRSVRVALRRPAALPLLLAATLVAAGCGSSDYADFVDGYNAAVAPLSTTMSGLSSSPAGDPAAAGKSLDKVADGLDDVRADLAALDPPEDAADEFDRMLGALEKGTEQVRAMAGAAKDGDVKKLTKATADFSATGTDLVTIEQELRTILEN